MSRMDKYEESNNENVVLSREAKNQDMYKDVYLNNTFVDYDEINLNTNEEEVVVAETVTTVYEEKNYDVNDYLRKAHENRVNDNVKRSLDDTDCEVTKVREKEDEISKLIASIEEKENEQKQDVDFFGDLMPDDDNTIITDPVDETKLENVIPEEEIEKYEPEVNNDLEEDFKDILDEKKKSVNKKLPKIVFSITLVLLVIVIILILFLI